MIRLSRESMEDAFVKYLETVFEHPEIIRANVRNIVINPAGFCLSGPQIRSRCTGNSHPLRK